MDNITIMTKKISDEDLAKITGGERADYNYFYSIGNALRRAAINAAKPLGRSHPFLG